MWIINFATGFFTPVTLLRVALTTLKALDLFFGIQRSNAFVPLYPIYLCTFPHRKYYRSIDLWSLLKYEMAYCSIKFLPLLVIDHLSLTGSRFIVGQRQTID